jgi:hypothetical protein
MGWPRKEIPPELEEWVRRMREEILLELIQEFRGVDVGDLLSGEVEITEDVCDQCAR